MVKIYKTQRQEALDTCLGPVKYLLQLFPKAVYPLVPGVP